MRRRSSNQRVALVPNQWSGSVQQYYHFLLGYLAPVHLWLGKTGASSITVRDCGPMNRWFATLPSTVDVEVMKAGHMLHVLAGNLQPTVILKGLDFPDQFNPKSLGQFRSLMWDWAGAPLASARSAEVLVIDRTATDPFYNSSESEIDMAGSRRRSVPNLGAWARESNLQTPVAVQENTNLDITEQILTAAGARLLIGQHGAGLTNMVFMQPGGVVVEIHPPLPAEAVETFARLASACGHRYVRVPQEGVHADVDPNLLSSAVRDFLT